MSFPLKKKKNGKPIEWRTNLMDVKWKDISQMGN